MPQGQRNTDVLAVEARNGMATLASSKASNGRPWDGARGLPDVLDGTLDAGGETGTEDSASDDDSYRTDEIEAADYRRELLDAQQHWEQSLEQLRQLVNWLLLPLIGRFLGRKAAGALWRRAMARWWGI